MNGEPTHWTVDKKIPLAILFAFFLQTGGAIWWAATMSARVTTLEDKVTASSDQRERIVKLEVILGELRVGINRIEAKLDRMSP